MRARQLFSLLVASALALTVGACGGDASDPADEAAATTTSAGAGGGNGAVVRVDMKDYAFAVSGSTTAGYGTIEMTNSGAEFHMMELAKLKPGKGLKDVLDALKSDDENAFAQVEEEEAHDSPAGLLSPGATQRVTTTFLTEGTYALICFLPKEGGGDPHFALGMVAEMKVEGSHEGAPTPDATYTIDDGTVDGPSTLKAGTTTIAAKAEGGPHEFFVIKKAKPEMTFAEGDKYFDGFESEGGPAKGFARGAPFTIVANTFDFSDGTVFFTVDLEPGRYFIGCKREADKGDPEHDELVEVTVT